MKSVSMSRQRVSLGAACMICLCALAPTATRAQGDEPPTQAVVPTDGTANAAAPDPGANAEEEGPSLPWQQGPKQLVLGNGVELDLPDNYDFLAMPEAGKLMEKMGNLYNENLLGIVTSREDSPWFITLRYDEEGYIKDDESIDGDELLEDMRDSLPEVNEEREAQGFPALTVDGWDEKPHYDKAAHHLVWCLRISDKEGSSANYNTRVLGRKGVVSVNLVTDPERVATDKPNAMTILGATRFASGSRYEDFDSSQDKVAEYGLAGLVAGGAGLGALKLVKLGLMAKMWKVILAALIAGKKAIVLLLVGAGAGIKKLLGRSKGSTEQA